MYLVLKSMIAATVITVLVVLASPDAWSELLDARKVEVVAELDVSPGNVAVSKEGRIFSSLHPHRKPVYQLIEVTGPSRYEPFPSKEAQSGKTLTAENQLDSPLGIIFDDLNRLWVIDMGFKGGTTSLIAYDIDKRLELMRFDVPQELAPAKGSFVQDLAIDEKNGFVYLADVRSSSIIVVNINTGTFRKITHLPTMQAEDIDMVIDGKVLQLRGAPARINLDPITLSADRETLYYSATNSHKWYKIPTKNIRNGESDERLISLISTVGAKPTTDGAATDDQGNHYFTNIENYSIDILTPDGTLRTLKKHPYFDWPDSVRIHGDWLYVAANQIYKSPGFHGGDEQATLPFRILRFKYR